MPEQANLSYLKQPLIFQTGIDKDSTPKDTMTYVDGEWVRSFEGRPSKIGGYTTIDLGTEKIVRAITSLTESSQEYIYFGRADALAGQGGLSWLSITARTGVAGARTDVTPDGFASPSDASWSFATFANQGEAPYPLLLPGQYLLAVANQRGLDVASDVEGQLYAHTPGSIAPAFPIEDQSPGRLGTPITTTGGVTFSSPLTLLYGKSGLLQWAHPGGFQKWSTDAGVPYQTSICAQDIYYAAPANGGDGLTFILWAPPQLIRATFLQAENFSESVFVGTPYPSSISLVSPNAVVAYDNFFYWIGNQQCYEFGGIVQPLPNNLSSNYFFDNVNPAYLARITGFAMPRFREIWWPWPDRDSIDGEANQLLILSLADKTWSVMPLDRSIGISPENLGFPILCSSKLENVPVGGALQPRYPIWQHETGLNKIITGLPQQAPIRSSIRTPLLTIAPTNPSILRMWDLRVFLPDFISQGEMELYIYTRSTPNGDEREYGPFLFGNGISRIDLTIPQALYVSLKYVSNTLNGYFKVGAPDLLYYLGDYYK